MNVDQRFANDSQDPQIKVIRESNFQIALTLTLSHPMGEGTCSLLSDYLITSLANNVLRMFEKTRILSLSHRMGEGRGEGFGGVVSP